MTVVVIHQGRQQESYPLRIEMSPSKRDRDLLLFYGELSRTAALMMQYNLSPGMDDIDTPDDLAHQLVLLKTLTHLMYEQKGQTDMFSLMRKAKSQLLTSNLVQRLDPGKQTTLMANLRWHLQDAIENPPPLVGK